MSRAVPRGGEDARPAVPAFPCPRAAPPTLLGQRCPPWRASEGDVGRNSTTSVSVSLYFILLHFIFFPKYVAYSHACKR